MSRAGALGKDTKQRPMIASPSKPEIKGELFRNSRKLWDPSHKDIRIGNDLTKTDLEREKQLYKKAKEKQAESGDQFKVKEPPWERKILKIPQAEKTKTAEKQ